jgi:hypothetical protein
MTKAAAPSRHFALPKTEDRIIKIITSLEKGPLT